jgi:pimeloyl-ACP methyl ester carboxylesterase
VSDPGAAHADALYLRSGSDTLFAAHSAPAGSSASGVGVLLCGPFGNGELCAHRSIREWALTLAAGGHRALRIDLPGTGDSSGGPRLERLAERWIEAVAAGTGWLREAGGCDRIVVVGVGLGGIVACAAAADPACADDLVLWAVPARGRTYVRELVAFARLEAAAAVPDPAPLPAGHGERTPSGAAPAVLGRPGIVSGGFAISAETVAALEALDLTAGDLGTRDLDNGGTRRALLLGRDGIEPDARLRAHLASAGWEVAVDPGEGYGAMLAEPYESRPPRATFAAVGRWLDAAPATAHRRPREPARADTSAEIEVTAAATIRERAFAVQMPFGSVPGVVSEPRTPAERIPGAPCVVFLNAGALRRVGPNRMWVEASRRFAARGVPSVRIDLCGIGDADGDDTGWEDDASFYVHDFVDQARAVVQALQTQGLGDRFLLAGLCSGAYWAFHAALEDERVTGAIMLNTRSLFWDGQRRLTQEASHSYKLAEARLWRKVVRAEISPRRMREYALAMLRLAARVPGRGLARLRSHARGGDRLDLALDRLQAQGKHLAIVFGPREQMRLELERSGRMLSLQARPNVTVDLLDGDVEVHTLEPLWLQAAVHELLDAALGRELSRIAAL